MKLAVLLSVALVFSCVPGLAVQAQQQGRERPASSEPPPSSPQSVEARPETGGAAAPVDPKSYIIGPEDRLAVHVWREPDVSQVVIVRPDGRITLPLVGDVQAGGLTPQQLSGKITEELAKFLNRPEVMVSVLAVLSKKYFITGEIYRTGAYPLVVPTTVLEALSSAGGFREWADQKNIIILRGNRRLKFNYKDVIRGRNLSQNIYLENGDHIIVP